MGIHFHPPHHTQIQEHELNIEHVLSKTATKHYEQQQQQRTRTKTVTTTLTTVTKSTTKLRSKVFSLVVYLLELSFHLISQPQPSRTTKKSQNNWAVTLS